MAQRRMVYFLMRDDFPVQITWSLKTQWSSLQFCAYFLNNNNNNNNNNDTKYLILYMPYIFIMRLKGPVSYCISILIPEALYLKTTSI
jgi:hypothetical protein